VLRDDNVTHAENVEIRGKIKQGKLQRRLDDSLTGGDQAIGEEIMQKDLSNEDMEKYRADYEGVSCPYESLLLSPFFL